MSSLIRAALTATAIAALPLLAGCATGGNVNVLSEAPATGLGQTYAWSKTTTSGDPRVDNDIVRDRMERAIEAAMAAKAYRKVDAAAADILLAYHIGVRDGTETRVDQSPSMMAPPMMCGRSAALPAIAGAITARRRFRFVKSAIPRAA